MGCRKDQELEEMIRVKYKTEAAMANALGWPRQRLNKITNGDKEPSLLETEMIARVLDEPVNKLFYIFLRRKSPNEQHHPA